MRQAIGGTAMTSTTSAENSSRMEGAMIDLNYWPMEAER